MREEWLRDLYERYFGAITKYCLPKLGFDESAAADCAHAVFDRAGEQYEKLKDHPNVLGWLMVTAKHLVHKNWSKKSRESSKSVPLELITALPDPRDPFDAVELSRTADEAEWLPRAAGYAVTRSSDAHNLDDVARVWTEAECEFSVAGLRAAFAARATKLSPPLTSF